MHFSLEKQDPNNYFGAKIGDPVGTTPYVSFLQNLVIFVNVGFPYSFSGPFRSAFSLGCQWLRMVTLGLLFILYTSTTWISGVLVGGGGVVSVEFVSISNSISLW